MQCRERCQKSSRTPGQGGQTCSPRRAPGFHLPASFLLGRPGPPVSCLLLLQEDQMLSLGQDPTDTMRGCWTPNPSSRSDSRSTTQRLQPAEQELQRNTHRTTHTYVTCTKPHTADHTHQRHAQPCMPHRTQHTTHETTTHITPYVSHRTTPPHITQQTTHLPTQKLISSPDQTVPTAGDLRDGAASLEAWEDLLQPALLGIALPCACFTQARTRTHTR